MIDYTVRLQAKAKSWNKIRKFSKEFTFQNKAKEQETKRNITETPCPKIQGEMEITRIWTMSRTLI